MAVLDHVYEELFLYIVGAPERTYESDLKLISSGPNILREPIVGVEEGVKLKGAIVECKQPWVNGAW